MKNPKSTQKTVASGWLKALLLVMALASPAAAPTAWAGEGNAEKPGVLPPDSKLFGRSYAEWSAKAVKTALELPLEGHPALDTNPNFDASYGQRGHVWFLGAVRHERALGDNSRKQGALFHTAQHGMLQLGTARIRFPRRD